MRELNQKEKIECGIQSPYSFLMKTKDKLRKKYRLDKTVKKEKEYLDHVFDSVDSDIVLDDTQRKAVVCNDDHIFMIAGAGSGKTTTLSAKIKYLMERKGVEAKKVLFITYTNQAVNELKEKIQGGFHLPVKIQTFHQFCYHLVCEFDKDYFVCDDDTQIILDILFEWKMRYPERYQTLYQNWNELFLVPLEHPNSFVRKFQNIVSLWTEFGYQKNDWELLKRKWERDTKMHLLLNVISELYPEYNKRLEENELITFSQMIQKANNILQRGCSLEYEYIFIDEFQDISLARYHLLECLIEQYHVKSVCVGDDFQSIFSFAGSEIDLFFQHLNSNYKVTPFYITNTFRNSLELIQIAGRFVMKNKKQLKKTLKSKKRVNYPIVLYSYQGDVSEALENVIQEIWHHNSKASILLLGRYRFDEKIYLESELFEIRDKKIQCSKYPELRFTYHTVHQSKGLGFDEVILLNGSSGKYGFPSEMKGDWMEKIFPINTDPVIEERRLFYVALTRTKHKVYILYPKYRVSSFVKELQREKNVLQKSGNHK